MLNIEKYKYILEEIFSDIKDKKCGDTYGLAGHALCVIYEEGTHNEHFDHTFIDIFDWLCSEYKEPKLDDKEREYLSSVIKPFRNKIKYIIKHSCSDDEYISIVYTGSRCVESTPLPTFRKGTMYKGMNVNKEYTLEELGLC